MPNAAEAIAVELVVRPIREVKENLRAKIVVRTVDDVLDRAANEIGES